MPDIRIARIALADCLPIRQAVLWPDLPRQACIVPGDADALHYGAFLAGRLAGCGSFFPLASQTVRLRKCAIMPDVQRRGLGSRLLRVAFAELRQAGYATVTLDARLTAVDFYRRFGLEPHGAPFVRSGLEYVTVGGALPGGIDRPR
ncbi:GCN5-related N-acetyltransferase [Gluconacetobacter diazotrophicus PA1 5]|nr:GNAT family N-acetyltransferase [Gluconacetobacter diazotrophicus]ACI51149.1 GCN5-related N-acetyltransferase [Gluconacetobacter diazotrophicus PA1 5]TWB07574.1 acetyltransferase (GNAT) family protein [Gluconacetobacter diazotrophicus]